MNQKQFPKGIKAALLVLILHLVLIMGFVLYLCFVKYPVIIQDDGLFLNRKFLEASGRYLLSILWIYLGVPVLLCIANVTAVHFLSKNYLNYLRKVQNTCLNAGEYFRRTYPEQQEQMAQTTYFSSGVELLRNDAQTLEPGKITAVFRNLRRCAALEQEFRELNQKCSGFRIQHGEQDFVQNLYENFKKPLTYSAVLLHQYCPELMQNGFALAEQYLNAGETGRYFRNTSFSSDSDYLLSEFYAPLETLSRRMQNMAGDLIQYHQEILKQNSIAELEIEPFPEEIQKKFRQAVALLEQIPSGRILTELSQNQKKYAAYRADFRDYAAVAAAYDNAVRLLYECITGTEHWMLKQLSGHYRIARNAYRMYLPEDSPYPEQFRQVCELLRQEAESGGYLWHMEALQEDSRNWISDFSPGSQNLQNRIDAVRLCAETINQAVRKDENTS